MSSYFDYQSKKTQPRKREDMVNVFVPEPPAQPIEVEESDPSATWLGRIFKWPKGTP